MADNKLTDDTNPYEPSGIAAKWLFWNRERSVPPQVASGEEPGAGEKAEAPAKREMNILSPAVPPRGGGLCPP